MPETFPITSTLLTFGCLFLVGLLADLAGRHSPLPRVTWLLLAGIGIGPSGLDVLPDFAQQWFPLLTHIALAMIGFLLGETMTWKRLREFGRSVFAISISVVLCTSALMFGVIALLDARIEVALLLAGIATATAPAATIDVVRELKAKGKFTDTLLGIVAIDDAWGLLMFGLLLAVAQALTENGSAAVVALSALWETGGAILVGLLIGLPMAYFTGRIRPGEPTQAEAIGFVILCAGVSEWLGVSYLLAAMVLGMVVANLAKHHERPFHVIEEVEWPFLILFFVLAGAAMHVRELLTAGGLTLAYISLRIAGRLLGAQIGGRLGGADPKIRNWVGLGLLPHAGVAIGMALMASQRFPELASTILPVVLGSTVVFELFGPVLTRWILRHVEEVPTAGDVDTGS